MSEDEDEYDDLPSISVNSSSRDSSVLSMPSAAVLASQRAREEETERELLLLRTQHDHPPLALGLAHSDSSGSESEASLAAAVTALQVQPGGAGPAGPATAAGPDAAELLTPLLPRLPQPDDFLADFLHAIEDADPDAASRLAEEVSSCLASAALARTGAWSEAEALPALAWLCCACVWSAPRLARARARRTLHRALDGAGGGGGGGGGGAGAGAALADLLRAVPAAARLELADAARSGAARGADALAARLVGSVLDELGGAGGWARLAAGARYLAVRAAGRELRAAAPARRRPLLDELRLPAPAAAGGAPHPDNLKVLVGAAKLHLLFRADK